MWTGRGSLEPADEAVELGLRDSAAAADVYGTQIPALHERVHRRAADAEDLRGLYPAAVWSGGPATPATDVTMSARCLQRLVGGVLGTGGGDLPPPLRALIDDHAGEVPPLDAAWALRDRLDEVARGVLGSPRFVPFALSGWVGLSLIHI